MTYQKPCASQENDPDDWFIGKDGRQYPDEELEPEAEKAALVRRRHAKDACFVDCLVRTRCLQLALDRPEPHGTWGGYYEEELRVIRTEIARRNKKR